MAFRIHNPKVDGIGTIDCNLLWWYIDVAVAVLADVHNGERGGGFFNLRNPSGETVFENPFRDPAATKADKYQRLAAEKTSRLGHHPEHLLSWQSKNEALEQYQGAARTPNGMLGGFSGFTAEEDEALVLWVFIKMGWMTGKEAYAFAKISSNSRWHTLSQMFDLAEETAD